MPYVIVERLFEETVGDSETRKYPAGWTGQVSEETSVAMALTGAGRVDADREATVDEASEPTPDAPRRSRKKAEPDVVTNDPDV